MSSASRPPRRAERSARRGRLPRRRALAPISRGSAATATHLRRQRRRRSARPLVAQRGVPPPHTRGGPQGRSIRGVEASETTAPARSWSVVRQPRRHTTAPRESGGAVSRRRAVTRLHAARQLPARPRFRHASGSPGDQQRLLFGAGEVQALGDHRAERPPPATFWPGQQWQRRHQTIANMTTRSVGRDSWGRWLPNHLVTTVVAHHVSGTPVERESP